MSDLPGSSAAWESPVPMKVAPAVARPTTPFGPNAAPRRSRRSAGHDSRKVEWRMIADEDDWMTEKKVG